MKRKEHLLTFLILLGLIAGILVGQFYLYSPDATPETLAQKTEFWQSTGDLVFIRPLKLMIIPLVFVSVVTGVTSIGNPQKLGLVGGATLVYYITTMLLAVALGLFLVNVIHPGVGVDPEQLQQQGQTAFETQRQIIETGEQTGVGGAFMNLLDQMIPTNPVVAAYEGNTLGVVVFSILLGLALVVTGKPAEPAIAFFDALFQALIRLVTWIIWIAPVGVFLLVAGRVGEIGLNSLVGPISLYMVTVLVGLTFHGAVTIPIVLWIFGRASPYKFLWAMRKPLITAFSTASSSATLPITIEEAEKSGGCSKKAANFVLPLGATVNMDGTALYQAVAVVFLFQMFEYDLTLTQQLVILITATLAAIGAAGIPSAGLVTMAIVISAVNTSLAATGLEKLPLWTIGIILGVDRILDMCRTAVNVWGDTAGAKIMTRLAPDVEEERAKAFA